MPPAATISPTLPDPGPAFRSLEAEVTLDSVPLEGELPRWLTGTLVRTGPAKFEAGTRRVNHWFDGLAMLHKFSFADGGVTYANRFLRTRAHRAATEEGRIGLAEFGTDPCRSIFRRFTSLFSPDYTDNANVNVARIGDRFVAMTETPIPVAFDPRTLETLGVAYSPPGRGPRLTTAHPHHDRERDEVVAYQTHLGPRSSYRLYAAPARAGGHDQRLLAKIPVREPAYMHSFGMSERYAVLTEQPLVVDPLRFAVGNRPFIENYRWEPQRGTRFHVVDRRDGTHVGAYEAEPLFTFHHVNAFERGDELCVDLVGYDDAGLIDAFYLDPASRENGIPTGRLRRYRIPLSGGQAERETLSEEPIEMPRIDYRGRNGLPYRYAYGIGANDEGAPVVKIDAVEGRAERWHEPGCLAGEPVFVAAPGATTEDEGVLLSLVLDAAGERSFLLVLDASDLAELARAEVPHQVPMGLHGQYFGSLG